MSGVSKIPGRIVLMRIRLPREDTSNRQGHADHAAFRCRVRSLTDLAIFRCDRRCVDDGATLPVDRIKGRHAGSRLRYASESTHQIDLNDQVELIQREVADLTSFLIAADGLDGIAEAGAVDKDALLTDCRTGLGEASIYGIVVADIYITEYATEILGEGFAFFLIEVKQGDFDAFFGESACRGGTEAEAPPVMTAEMLESSFIGFFGPLLWISICRSNTLSAHFTVMPPQNPYYEAQLRRS